MNKFSFNSIKHTFLPVELPNGETVTLQEPRKKDLELLESFSDTNDISAIYSGMAKILSTNMEGMTITVTDLEDLTVADVVGFMNAYTDFTQSVMPKN